MVKWGRVIAFTVASAALLSGCVPFVPTRPNDAPLELGVDQGEIVFRWCGSTAVEARALAIGFRVVDATNNYVSAFEGTGAFSLDFGSEISIDSPPDGVARLQSTPIPLATEPTYVFFNTGESLRELSGMEAVFYIESPALLGEGQWLTTSGETVRGECSSPGE